jgi:hypothetical protein
VPGGPNAAVPVLVQPDGTVTRVPLPAAAPRAQVVASTAVSAQDSIAVTGDGRVFSTDPTFDFGDLAGRRLNAPIVSMALHRDPSSGDATGYWLLGADGGVFTFGDAGFHGSTGARKLNKPISTITPSASGAGYWLVAGDGGVFTFGDARFHGSTGNLRLNKPVVALTPTPTGDGYWLLGADGGVFTFGDAPFHGAATGTGARFVAAIPTPTGGGYHLLAGNGKTLAFGDAA